MPTATELHRSGVMLIHAASTDLNRAITMATRRHDRPMVEQLEMMRRNLTLGWWRIEALRGHLDDEGMIPLRNPDAE